jgi:hypothetical protein
LNAAADEARLASSGGPALVAGGFGLFAAAGYVCGSSVLYGVGTFIPMAVNTAVGFLILSAGVL